jgi:tRNA threonylcarbamoyl adenosine modification protein YeaZ
MKTLILETSTEKGLIALSVDGSPVASRQLSGGPELSKTLALEVQTLLKTHSFHPDLIAVGKGPGSYTGIRVGAALAKALAFGWGIPVLGFCSLKAYMSAGASALLIDARGPGFYVLRTGGSAAVLLSPEAAAHEFRDASCLASPHPDLIRKRLETGAEWIETAPDPALIVKEKFETVRLTYP